MTPPGDNYPYHLPDPRKGFATLLIILLAMLLFGIASCQKAHAYTIDDLADAIYKAEGGSHTRHPYGILTRYKHTTPRQACINTIRHAMRDWDGKTDFLVFLGSRYCPVEAHPLNKNWVRNVRRLLNER